MKVFVLIAFWYDDIKILGIYQDKLLAIVAQGEFVKMPEYDRYGFDIEEHEVQS